MSGLKSSKITSHSGINSIQYRFWPLLGLLPYALYIMAKPVALSESVTPTTPIDEILDFVYGLDTSSPFV